MAIYLSEETSPTITKLLLTKTGLENIIELAIVSSNFGVHIRDPKTEETVYLVDKWLSGTGLVETQSAQIPKNPKCYI
jgi:hypothetical protein